MILSKMTHWFFICGLVHLGPISSISAVWKCEYEDVSEYQCRDDGDAATVIAGIFMNSKTENVTKSFKKAGIYTGVQVLHPHNVNYEAINASLQGHSIWNPEHSFEKRPEFLAQPLSLASGLELRGETGVLLYQTRTTCAARFGGRRRGRTKDAVKVFSSLFEFASFRINLKAGCKFSTESFHVEANYDDSNARLIRNSGSTFRDVEVSFKVGVDSFGGEYKTDEGRQDDTKELITWLNAQVANKRINSGGAQLDWATKYTPLTEFGYKETKLVISVPPNRTAIFLQAMARCGGGNGLLDLLSWVFPVFLPLSFDRWYEGECESPDIEPLCVYRSAPSQLVGQPKIFIDSDSCKDLYTEIPVPDGSDASQIQVDYGMKGPHAEKLGDNFKILLMMTLRGLGVRDSWYTEDPITHFNWGASDVPDWTNYKPTNAMLEVPKVDSDVGEVPIRAFQLTGRCSVYSLLTHYVVFVHLDKNNRCLKLSGNVPEGTTCEVMEFRVANAWVYGNIM